MSVAGTLAAQLLMAIVFKSRFCIDGDNIMMVIANPKSPILRDRMFIK